MTTSSHTIEVLLGIVLAGTFSFAGLLFHRILSNRWRLFWKVPGGRHWHLRALPSGGGWPILVAFALGLIFHPTFPFSLPFIGMLAGLAILLIAGLADDLHSRSWKWMLAAQIFAASMLLLSGVKLYYVNGLFGEALRLDQWSWGFPYWLCLTENCVLPILGSLLVIAWIVVLANALNWLDGTDGAAISVVSVAFAGLVVLSLSKTGDQPATAIAAGSAFGASLPFLFFNAPRARLMLGSSGSYGIAFVLGSLAIVAGAKLATVAMTVLLPLADACAVVAVRLWAHQRPWLADTRHLHHDLARRGWSAWRILTLHAGFSGFFGATALFIPRPEKLVLLGGAFVLCVIILFVLKIQREPARKSHYIKKNALQL